MNAAPAPAAILAPAELQTFAQERDRARLSPVAIKAFLNLAKAWELTNAEAAALIGVSASTPRPDQARLSPDAQPGPAHPRLGAGRPVQGPASPVRRRDGRRLGEAAQ